MSMSTHLLGLAAADHKELPAAMTQHNAARNNETDRAKSNEISVMQEQLAERLTQVKIIKNAIQGLNVRHSVVGELMATSEQRRQPKPDYNSLVKKEKRAKQSVIDLMGLISDTRIRNAINEGDDVENALKDEIGKLQFEAAGIQLGKQLTVFDVSDDIHPNFRESYRGAIKALTLVYDSYHEKTVVNIFRNFLEKTIIHLPYQRMWFWKTQSLLKDYNIDRQLLEEIENALIHKEMLKRNPDYDVNVFNVNCINMIVKNLNKILSYIVDIKQNFGLQKNALAKINFLKALEADDIETEDLKIMYRSPIIQTLIRKLKQTIQPAQVRLEYLQPIKDKLNECLNILNPYVCNNIRGKWVPKEKDFLTNSNLWDIAQVVYKNLIGCLDNLNAASNNLDDKIASINHFIKEFEAQKNKLDLFLKLGNKSKTLSPIITKMNELVMDIKLALANLDNNLKWLQDGTVLAMPHAAAVPTATSIQMVRAVGGSPLHPQNKEAVAIADHKELADDKTDKTLRNISTKK